MLLDDLRLQEQAGRIVTDPFNYSAVFPIAAFLAGVQLPINIPINNDSDFIWRYTTLVAYTAPGAILPAPDFTITFFDTGAGRALQDQALHVQCCTGTAQLPFILPEPKRISAASVLTVTMVNNEAAAQLAYVMLGGFKVFNIQGYSR